MWNRCITPCNSYCIKYLQQAPQIAPQMMGATQYMPVQQVMPQQIVTQPQPFQQIALFTPQQSYARPTHYVDWDDLTQDEDQWEDVDCEIIEPFGDYKHQDDSELEVLDDDEWLRQNLSVDEVSHSEQSSMPESAENEDNIDLSIEESKLSEDDRLGMDDAFDEAWMGKELVVISKEVSKPIKESIKKFAASIWNKGIKKPKELHITEAYKILYRPENADEFVVPEFNDILKQLIPKKKRDRDILPLSIDNALLKARGALQYIWLTYLCGH